MSDKKTSSNDEDCLKDLLTWWRNFQAEAAKWEGRLEQHVEKTKKGREVTKTIWEHDCENCVYLGPFKHERGSLHDLYWCAQGGMPTVIARYGSDGPEYTSGMIFARNNSHSSLVEAMHRSQLLGLDLGEKYYSNPERKEAK